MVVLHLGRHERNKGVFKDVSNEGTHSSWDKSPLGFLVGHTYQSYFNILLCFFFLIFFVRLGSNLIVIFLTFRYSFYLGAFSVLLVASTNLH